MPDADLAAAVAAARAGQRAEATWGNDPLSTYEGILQEDAGGLYLGAMYVRYGADRLVRTVTAFRVLPDVAPDPEPELAFGVNDLVYPSLERDNWLVPKVPDDPEWRTIMVEPHDTPSEMRVTAAEILARADAIDAAARAQAHSSDITAEELAQAMHAGTNSVPWTSLTDGSWQQYRRLAEAALDYINARREES